MRNGLLGAMMTTALLAGCGGDAAEQPETQAAATTTPAATTTEEPTPEPTPKPPKPTASGGSAKVTPLGTTLKVGRPAVIRYTDSGSKRKKSIIRLTPGDIRKGKKSDFADVDLDKEQKSAVPYYATIRVENIGKGDLSRTSPATYINGVDDRGQDQNEVIFFGDFPACDHENPKSLKPGEAYEACLVYLLPKGASLEGFHWIQFDEASGKSDLNWK